MWVQCLLRQSEGYVLGVAHHVALRFSHDPAELLSPPAAGELSDLPRDR